VGASAQRGRRQQHDCPPASHARAKPSGGGRRPSGKGCGGRPGEGSPAGSAAALHCGGVQRGWFRGERGAALAARGRPEGVGAVPGRGCLLTEGSTREGPGGRQQQAHQLQGPGRPGPPV
ncbi:unnamed protein product, partial [Gulo gulo]